METISGRVSMIALTSGSPNTIGVYFQGKEGDDPKYPKGGQFDLKNGEVWCDGERLQTIGQFFEWFLSRSRGPVHVVLHDNRHDYLAAQKAEFTTEMA